MPSVPISHQSIVRKLRQLGFSGPFHVGKHPYMKKGSLKVHIPNPHGKTIDNMGLLRNILRQAGISDQAWDAA